ncbi:hypothetical protein L593_08200 [Salinarchaeum sp. Harcht-Bsk1]|uniref:hypothetical protein n=1 Tax=Salinarchaeum sp. Harcht-Bsk1 TaxID=1333523 RepID=UPI0003423811|nr:hypothetical protein [Salinarchaeum sp. Harcht-Bsk1]AGN01585.1 hypothetical protein L593_08200 [Salinarchaeum sp. Harcht-Bsk1]
MTPVPLQWMNDFLLAYNIGHAILVGFVLSVLAILPLQSRKVFALNAGLFGTLFVITPISASAYQWRLFGFVLLVLAPLLYLTSDE